MDIRVNWSGRSHNYSQKAINAVLEVMNQGDPQTQGKYLKRFESAFSDYTKAPFCFGVTNCTHALELIADLIGLKTGDEVIIPAHTYCASAIPFGRTGAKIKWADINPETFEVSLNSIKSLCTDKTKLIVVVHLYGMMCDVKAISDFAESRSILLAEDCAQSLGAFQDDQSCGTFGEGGMLVVRDEKLASLVPGIRHNGHKPFLNQDDYWRPAMSNVDLDIKGVWPHNLSLSEVQAALGTVLLTELDQLTEARRKRFQFFKDQMSPFDEIVLQKYSNPLTHSHHLLVARYDGKSTGKNNHDLIEILFKHFGIKAIVQYYPLYRYDLFQKMGFGEADCPHTDYFYDNMVSFPFHIWMSDEDFEYMIESTKKALNNLRGE